MTKVHLKYLDQSYKMVIDPRNEKALQRKKKKKLTTLEKQLSAHYIETSENEEEDENDIQEDFINRFYKDFNF